MKKLRPIIKISVNFDLEDAYASDDIEDFFQELNKMVEDFNKGRIYTNFVVKGVKK